MTIRWQNLSDMIYGSTCHEGNYGLTNILAGAREKEAAMDAAAGR